MKVSVIIPVFNSEKYLNACVESVIAQTYTPLEVILVDDGSTDSSPQICDDFAGKIANVKVVHQANGGLSNARNAGVEVATGDYLMFVDADDMIHPSCIKTLVNAIKPGDIGVAKFTDGTVCNWSDINTGHIARYKPGDAIELTLYQRHINNSACGKLFPASLFKTHRFRDGLYYEDLDIFYRLYEDTPGEIVSVDHPMYFYRKSVGSIINTFNKRRLDVLQVVDRIEQHYADNPRLLRAANDRKFSANCNMFILSSQAGLEEQAEKCWQVIQKFRAQEIKNSKVRIKNKLGALLSFFGKNAMLFIAKSVYR